MALGGFVAATDRRYRSRAAVGEETTAAPAEPLRPATSAAGAR